VASVSTGDVQGWLDRLKDGETTKALSGTSKRNYERLVSLLFEFCLRRGYVRVNPCERLDAIDAENGEIEIYSPTELASMISAASPEFLPGLVLQAFCGVRSQEVLRLDWHDVDLARKILVVAKDKAKTRSRRIVPIPTSAMEWLAPYAQRKGKIWTGIERDFYEAAAATCETARVPKKQNGLRHSFISYRLSAIQSADAVALEAGNSASVVFKNYRELTTAGQAAAWFAVSPKRPENVEAMGRTA